MAAPSGVAAARTYEGLIRSETLALDAGHAGDGVGVGERLVRGWM